MFWIANQQNSFHNNAAVGGSFGFWVFTHSQSEEYRYQGMMLEPWSHHEWTNNKARVQTAQEEIIQNIYLDVQIFFFNFAVQIIEPNYRTKIP